MTSYFSGSNKIKSSDNLNYIQRRLQSSSSSSNERITPSNSISTVSGINSLQMNSTIPLTTTTTTLHQQQQQQQQQHHHQLQHQQYQQQQQQQYNDNQNSDPSSDSLEYFIKFPTPNYDLNSDYVFVYNQENVPIIMLLGWAGCQDRYLMKYSKIYEDRGLITIRYTAPVENLFWKRSAMKPIGEKILKLIYDMNFDNHPIIFHVFSNGGAYLYQHISLAIHNNNKPINIYGMIFDSAPGERRFLGLFRAVTAIYSKERKKCNCLTALFITFTLTVMWFMEETYYAFKSLFMTCERPQVNPFHDLKNELSDWPQLFLYSKGDTIIPYKDIEKFANYRQQKGIDITKICFDDAEHVKIYTKYPKQYIQYLCKFVNKCLSSYRSKYD